MSPEAHHHGRTVSDMERSLEFYRDTLGLEEISRVSLDSEAFNTLVGTDGATADIAFLDAGGCLIELLAYEPSGRNANDGIDSNDVGASHFSLEVDDVDAWYDRLVGDVEFVSPPQTLDGGETLAYLRDPDGNVVELIENPPL